MRHLLGATLLCLLATTQAVAADTPASDQSIRRLMEITDSRKMMEGALASVDASMDAAIKSSLGGKQLDEKTQKAIDDMRRKIGEVLREGMAWSELEPLFMKVYRDTLTQDEVNGMLKFYESDAGKAVIRKMPLILQSSVQLTQQRMQAMMPKIIEIQRETMEQMKEASSSRPPVE